MGNGSEHRPRSGRDIIGEIWHAVLGAATGGLLATLLLWLGISFLEGRHLRGRDGIFPFYGACAPSAAALPFALFFRLITGPVRRPRLWIGLWIGFGVFVGPVAGIIALILTSRR
jgi:hypothetical protein